jgi:hypothetical protein
MPGATPRIAVIGAATLNPGARVRRLKAIASRRVRKSRDDVARLLVSVPVDEPLPVAPAWMERLLAFDPKRVGFAHDAAVLEPA